MFNKLIYTFAAMLMIGLASQASAQEDSATKAEPLPISSSPSASSYAWKPMTFAQQRARFEAEQRALRMEWNNWIGYSPLRPSANASYMSNSYYSNYFSAQRGIMINTGRRGWYW